MGAWGEDPFDNDNASDWLYETGIWVKIEDALEEVGAGTGDPMLGYTSEAERARAAIELMLLLQESGTDSDLLGDAAEWLDAVIADGSYFDGWRDPRKIKNDFKRQRDAVKALHKKVTPKRRKRR